MFDEKDLIESTTHSSLVYSGKVVSLYVDDASLKDGTPIKREYVSHRGGACVLALDNEDCIYLVRQFRYPYKQVLWEIPAGKLEPSEPPLHTAIRERKEETGLVADCVQDFGVIYPTPGYTNEKLFVYLATHLRQEDAHPDEGELLNVVRMPLQKAYQMILDGEIVDAKTCFAILKYLAQRSQQ